VDYLSKSERPKEKGFLFVNKCIGESNSTGKFHLTFAKSASSLYESAPAASNYTVINSDGTAQIWGLHTKVVKTIKVKVYSLDWLVEKKKVPNVDFLSMDTQGAELLILNGASSALKNWTIGVACETDFVELYQNQPLFSDIASRLAKDRFRLCQIFNHQFFNNWPYYMELQGKGFVSASESLFLKDPNFFDYSKASDVTKALKLAAIGVVFDQLDFSLGIIKTIQDKKILSIGELAKRTKVFYLRMLNDLYESARHVERRYSSPEYTSTNFLDRGGSKVFLLTRIAKNFSKVLIFFHYLLILFGGKVFGQNKAYFSKISRIYSKYGLDDLAEVHNKRYLYYLLNLYPSKVDRILNLFFSFKFHKQMNLANRNYFKGSYR
jgi:FkbM family methyltransferase